MFQLAPEMFEIALGWMCSSAIFGSKKFESDEMKSKKINSGKNTHAGENANSVKNMFKKSRMWKNSNFTKIQVQKIQDFIRKIHVRKSPFEESIRDQNPKLDFDKIRFSEISNANFSDQKFEFPKVLAHKYFQFR